MVGGGYCRECFEKQREIDRLTEENVRLRGRLRYQERVSREEGFFGSSTPSSKIPVKANTDPPRRDSVYGAVLRTDTWVTGAKPPRR
jgi:hypothetical protein